MSETAVRAYVRERRFSSATSNRWLQQNAADRDAMLALAERLRLGENQFRDLLDQLQDVAVRQRSSVAAVLENDPLADVLRRTLGRNEMVKALKQCLQRLRYPKLTATEDRLKQLVRCLGMPPGVEVLLPENLGSSCLSFTLRVSSPDELDRCAAALATAARGAEMQEIFRVLEGDW
jgi:hypothetical protein